MKHTKREWIPLYNFLDRTRLTAHLSEMAAQGWLLTSISSWSWKYRRTEPRKLKFAVTFFAGAGSSPRPGTGAGHLPGLLRPGRMAGRRQHGSGAGLLQRG